MAIFGVEMDTSIEGFKYISDTRERFKDHNIITNPFVAKIEEFIFSDKGKAKTLAIVSMEPIYFNFTIFAWLGLPASLYFFGFTWPTIFPVIVCLLGIFWTREFFFLMFILGLKKVGYKGKSIMRSPSQVLDIVYFKEVSK